MENHYNSALLIGAGLSVIAALLHLWVIKAGPRGYRLFGAGERFIRAAEAGKIFPAVATAGIATVLLIWAAYALSGAGAVPPLPLLRPVLCFITFIYLLRAIAGPLALRGTGRSNHFIIVCSLICLGVGLVHLLGLVQRWSTLA
ncbi:hypothetical protein [Serratia proteamaculans]|uniref:hypothetical protein n=1 Tax=Serratia proteamaculans TaxID=28151 RepID=UPI00218343FC|nr:hypothetical protein [Serratia proteamaculans]CAI2411979.1 Uncharacterised protein [Serratia proteamaculans]